MGHVLERRVDEAPQPVRHHLAEAPRPGELVEAYRRITTAEALAYIAGGFCSDQGHPNPRSAPVQADWSGWRGQVAWRGRTGLRLARQGRVMPTEQR